MPISAFLPFRVSKSELVAEEAKLDLFSLLIEEVKLELGSLLTG